MTDSPTPARDALAEVFADCGGYWTPERSKRDRSRLADRVAGDPAVVLAALVEAHGLDTVLRHLGGTNFWHGLQHPALGNADGPPCWSFPEGSR